MRNSIYLPEGQLISTPENRRRLSCAAQLERAMNEETILEARPVLCDGDRNLIFDFGDSVGIMPRDEVCVAPDDTDIRDIAVITRVGKPMSFLVSDIKKRDDGKCAVRLSRKRLQEKCLADYLDTLDDGDVIEARVTHFESFGAFCDIGCGIVSLLSIDRISVSRIAHPSDRFSVGDMIYAAVKGRDEVKLGDRGRISLTHRELLGTWEQNADKFAAGQTVTGVVRSVENYGIFVELSPNLAGLAEYKSDVLPQMTAAVYIKSIIPSKRKIKLVIVDAGFDGEYRKELTYYITSGNVKDFDYYG